MRIDRDHVREEFRTYTDRYDSHDPKVALKIDHTYRVAEDADRISNSEDVAEEDQDIGWFLGMMHDIGRFEQLKNYHTFYDAKSVNHAAYGADILFHGGLIRTMTNDCSEDALIEKAIRLHNVFELPEGLSDRERFFCDLIRDADKVDILKVICVTPFDDIYDCTLEELRWGTISEPAYADILQHRTVNRKTSSTYMDAYINKISFVYGLVYPESFRIVREQGYLDQLLAFESENPDTKEKMKKIREDVNEYINGKCGSCSL
ncbi:MAG: HD domain-containing protein [Lachnospiraceae bacterium]|nr:HD domain-containing protein [Lachnospiraceae bacterium]